jgi:hypothetical protein
MLMLMSHHEQGTKMSNVINLPTTQTTAVTQKQPDVPEFITRSDIASMDDDQLDALVAAIRTRRMLSYEIYKRTKSERGLVDEAKFQTKLDKKCEQIIKKIDTLDKQLEVLEHHIAELRGLRLQAGLTLI